jgi:hypothetical protein
MNRKENIEKVTSESLTLPVFDEGLPPIQRPKHKRCQKKITTLQYCCNLDIKII